MLSPGERQLLFKSLRPPSGYELSSAIGTTYSLDLMALLAAPLAFTLFGFEEQDGGGRPVGHPLALLEALRRHAGRIALFCQAGQIKVPPPDRLLLEHLEGSVFETTARHEGGVFHPKVWLLRYVAEDEPVRYRLLCLSRNLTFDRSWDTVLTLDGVLKDRQRAIPANNPLGDFIAALPGLAERQVPPRVQQLIETMQSEVRRVAFDLPEGITEMDFWPLGIADESPWPFESRVDRLLVVAPFLSKGGLEDLTDGGGGNDVLVSRPEALDELGGQNITGFSEIKVLNDGAQPEPADDQSVRPEQEGELVGLHAKVYVADAGWNASVWVGSANASGAAFDRNVEFLVRLQGSKSRFGIDQLIESSEGEMRFGDLLVDYSLQAEPAVGDAAETELEREADRVKALIAAHGLVARVTDGDSETGFSVELRSTGSPPDLPAGLELHAWPVTQREAVGAQPLSLGASPAATFKQLALESLTTFYAVGLRLVKDGMEYESRFVLNLPLENEPEKRREAILRAMIADQAGLVRYLLFLLQADADPLRAAGAIGAAGGTAGRQDPSVFGTEAVFELLVRALDRDPSRLDQVGRLIDDLRETEDGRQLLPSGLDEILKPVRQAQQALKDLAK